MAVTRESPWFRRRIIVVVATDDTAPRARCISSLCVRPDTCISTGVLFNQPAGRELIKAHQIVLLPSAPPFDVDSGFGGIALYSRAALAGCRYAAPHDDCEHIALHACVRARHGARVLVAPRLLVQYDLPCDPGPGVDPKTCYDDPAIAREIAAHAVRRGNMREMAAHDARRANTSGAVVEGSAISDPARVGLSAIADPAAARRANTSDTVFDRLGLGGDGRRRRDVGAPPELPDEGTHPATHAGAGATDPAAIAYIASLERKVRMLEAQLARCGSEEQPRRRTLVSIAARRGREGLESDGFSAGDDERGGGEYDGGDGVAGRTV